MLLNDFFEFTAEINQNKSGPRRSRDEPIYEIFFGFFQKNIQKSWYIFLETCSQIEVQLG
jgi:hypothetical protein